MALCRNLVSQRILQRCVPSSFLSRSWSSKVGEGELQALTPVPDRDYKRKAVIFKPSGPAGQFGYNVKEMHGGGVSPWKVWLPTQEMWTNPLMGWAASSDTAESSFRKMTFKSAEDAAEFLKKQGIPFEIEDKPENWDSTYRPSRYAGYGDNFSTKRKGIPDLSHLPSNRK